MARFSPFLKIGVMTAFQRRCLRANVPVLGQFLRRRAAAHLVRDGSAQAIRDLAEFFVVSDPTRREQIAVFLKQLKSSEGIDALCSVWEETRDPALTQLLVVQGWTASEPERLSLLTALKVGCSERAANCSPEALDHLLAACNEDDPDLSARARTSLERLTKQATIDRLWQQFASGGNPVAGAALRRLGRVARSPERLHVYSSLTLGRPIEQESHDSVLALMEFAFDNNRHLAEQARERLARLRTESARELFCQSIAGGDHPALAQIAIDARYRPADPIRQALFLFLTEQWEAYEALDFEQRLLNIAYSTSPRRVRGRLAEKARQAGRMEWITAVAQCRATRKLQDLTRQEWEAVSAMLIESNRWPDLWGLVQHAPVNWSALVCRRLREQAWTPADAGEREGFLNLAQLALQCTEEPDFITPGMRDVVTLQADSVGLTALAVSHDGRFAAAGSRDGQLRFWDLVRGDCLQTAAAHRRTITSISLEPEERLIVAGGADGRIQFWSFPEGIPATAASSLQAGVRCSAFGPHGAWIVTGDEAGSVRIFWPNLLPMLHLGDHDDAVSCLALSEGGRFLASGGLDRVIRVWSVPDGMPLAVLKQHEAPIRCLSFQKHGRSLLSAGDDCTLRIWDLSDGIECATLPSHTEPITCLALHPNGAVAATGSQDGSIRIWDLARKCLLATLGHTDRSDGHTAAVSGLAFCPKRDLLASGGRDGRVQLWSVPGGAPLAALALHLGPVSCLEFARDGQSLITGDSVGRICVWQSELDAWRRLPLAAIGNADAERVDQLLAHSRLSMVERNWLEFLSALLRWRQRFEIGLADPHCLTVGEFDLEIESDSFLPKGKLPP